MDELRILILALNFHPELTGIGKYTGEMAAHLAAQGHQVRAITTPPYYPHWKVQPGYRGWAYRREEWAGVQVWRCALWVPRSPSGIKRILHLLSFALSSVPALIGQLSWRPAVVLCIAPAMLSAPLGLLAARLCGASAWLHIQDFEVDAAAQLGLLSSGGLARLAARMERWLLRSFDRVSTISDRMASRLEEKGVLPERIRLFPNWVDTAEIHPLGETAESLREPFGIPGGKTVVLYSGNMGNKQGLEVVIECAQRLQPFRSVHFVLCGEGSARAGLEEMAKGLANVQFLPLQPEHVLNRLLNAADIHVLPQKAGAADLVMPSKLLGMLASGRPVVALAEPGTGIAEVVRGAGYIVPPDQPGALSEAILLLAGEPQLRRGLGAKGRQVACERWGKAEVLGRFEEGLMEAVEEKRTAKEAKTAKNAKEAIWE